MKAKYQYLLTDQTVKDWYDNVCRGSKITGDVYLRRLGSFCIDNNTTPTQLIKMKEKERERIILTNITKMTQDGAAGSYINAALKAVKSWLAWNDIEIKKKIKINGAGRTPSLKDETVPSQEELKQILNAADTRERVAIALIAFAGLRLETLGNYTGADGLTIGDFPELEIKDGTVLFTKIPTMVRVREDLSKAGHSYFSFLGPEGCQYIKAYLESRIKHGEILDKSSPILVPVRQKPHFITTINISNTIRTPMRLAGNNNRPYVLRSYFATQCMQAESKGLIRDYRTFMMGHLGDIEHTYTLNKNHISQELVDKMREAYTSALPYLETSYDPRSINNAITSEVKSTLLKLTGFSDDEIKALSEKPEDEVIALIKEKLGQKTSQSDVQTIVNPNEAEPYIKQGYQYVNVLPDGRWILRTP